MTPASGRGAVRSRQNPSRPATTRPASGGYRMNSGDPLIIEENDSALRMEQPNGNKSALRATPLSGMTNRQNGETNVKNLRRTLKNVLPDQILENLRDFKYRNLRIENYQEYTGYFSNKNGLEIGGPSSFFRYFIPVYAAVSRIDGVNFATETVWEGLIDQRNGFKFYKNRRGKQFIGEATNLSQITDNSYDFVISSNCLEHVANPIKALEEWKRVAKNDGHILLVLPNKMYTFDHKRETTTFGHLYGDYTKNTTEHDMTHLDEILLNHDLSMDPPSGNYERFKARSIENYNNRCLHHHVFDMQLIYALFEFLRIRPIKNDSIASNYVALGEFLK
jgi:SAM-dependent methyltransferase